MDIIVNRLPYKWHSFDIVRAQDTTWLKHFLAAARLLVVWNDTTMVVMFIIDSAAEQQLNKGKREVQRSVLDIPFVTLLALYSCTIWLSKRARLLNLLTWLLPFYCLHWWCCRRYRYCLWRQQTALLSSLNFVNVSQSESELSLS